MIEVANLRKVYRSTPINPLRKPVETRALESISLRVERGEAVALVGLNGAGKTTLLKILATLVLPDGGSASISGFDVIKASASVKSRIGLVTGDERSFYWRLTGRENLFLFGALQNIHFSELRNRVESMLDTFGIQGQADMPFRSYSTGMRQRLALARCLLHEPEVLLLDEPNKGIDPVLQVRSVSYIRDELVSRRKHTVLFATHNLEEAIALGGRVALLESGRLIYFDRPESADQLRKLMEPKTNQNNAKPEN